MTETTDEQRRRCRRYVADAATGYRGSRCRRLPSDRAEPKCQDPLDRRLVVAPTRPGERRFLSKDPIGNQSVA